MATLTKPGTLGATDSTVEFQTNEAGAAGVEISGTWTGTITLESKIGSVWVNAQVFNTDGTAAAATMTANGSRVINASGFSAVRARFSTASSGAPVVVFAGSPEPPGGGGGGAVTVTGGTVTANAGTGPFPTIGYQPAAPTCTFTRPANVTPYTIGDEVGTAGTAPTTIPVARANGLGGIIQGAQVFYSGYPAINPQLVLLVFSATVTLAGDNAQLNLSDADAAKLICRIPLTSVQSSQYSAGAPVSAGGIWLSGVPDRPSPHFICGGSETTLYFCLITLNAFTPIANSEQLSVVVDVEQN